ncbi:TPA: baseplate J/gp47 family protein [Escherichia coli]|nr:baseplate J/gp47 family protein [Escherichia coli]HAN4698247.1 baseplate J/gp47 family protein [Escherichia coli]
MPSRIPKACRVRGCRHTTTDPSGYCESHKSEGWKQYKPGQSRHQRGYGSKWDVIRVRVLKRDKGLCQLCLRAGVVREAKTVDHIIPKAHGVLRVPIACSSAGAVGNADDGTSLILVTPVNGLPSSGEADTLTGGFDTEELETWRARVIERYYWTPQGGADGDYVVWAKEVPGITRAWTYRHWMGTGTVGVMIASSDLINPIPEESTETAARQHIGPLAPVAGSDLYVFRPVAHKVDFHIRVTPDTPEIRAAITAELRSFLLRDGYPQGELKVSRISEAISGANGEYSHQLLAPADNIPIAKNELAVLGTISWT